MGFEGAEDVFDGGDGGYVCGDAFEGWGWGGGGVVVEVGYSMGEGVEGAGAVGGGECSQDGGAAGCEVEGDGSPYAFGSASGEYVRGLGCF